MKPLLPLTRFLSVLLKINLGILIIAVVADIYSWYEYANLSPDIDADEILLTSDWLNVVVGIIQFLFGILLGVTFLRWIYRANKNLHTLSSEPMRFSPGWSIGWYFIPIANLFKPYQAMKEIWTVTHRGALHGGLLGWWWFFWIVSNMLGRMTMRISFRVEDAQGYAISALVDAISDGVDVGLSVIALALVGRIARAYHLNYTEIGVAQNIPAANQSRN